MRWNRFIISLLLACVATTAMADSIYMDQPSESLYDRRVNSYRKHWAALIPTQFVVQNAGNMGVVSTGIGWDYGKRRQWETHLLLGYIPRHQSTRGKLTTTLKENYIPWSVNFSRVSRWPDGLSIEPLSVSIYLNTVYGHEFWKSQPGRYPDGYYQFMSTKFRLNVALGQHVTLQIPAEKRHGHKSITLFYEVSTCDLYIRAKFQDGSVPLKDILGLSIGLKIQAI